MGTHRAGLVLCLTAMVLIPTAVGAATLTIAWDPSSDPAVVGYKVSAGTQSGVYTVTVDAGAQTIEQFSNLTPGATYYFVVQAYDSVGDLSAPSAEVAGLAPTSSPLAITCPVPTATSTNGSPVAVTFAVTVSGGVAPVSASCSPTSGSLFPVGSTPVSCSARDSIGATATCSTTVLVSSSATSSPPPPAPAPSTAVDTTGAISTLVGRCPYLSFTVNGKTIMTTSATTYARGSCNSLSNGKQVEVVGTTQSNGTVLARSVSPAR